MRRLRAFTLVELLIVITLIVLLLALLTPALDKAVEQAQLTVCSSKLHAVASGALTYAMDHKRRYPYRDGMHNPDVNWHTTMLNSPLEPTGAAGRNSRTGGD